MVIVTMVPEYPQNPDAGAQLVPIDAGRWAVLEGGSEAERRRVAGDLRRLAYRRSAPPTLAA